MYQVCPVTWQTGKMSVGKLTPERRRQLTRDALLDGAEQVFVKRGVPGASMEEIAAEAGFSRGALYAHFGSKEELLLAVMDRFLTQQVEQFRDLVGSEEPMAAAIDAAEIVRNSYSPALVPLELELRTNALRNPELRQRLIETDRKRSEETAQVIQNLMGDIDQRIGARDLADIGRAAIIGLLMYAAVDSELRDHYEGLVETVFVLLTETLTPPPTAAS